MPFPAESHPDVAFHSKNDSLALRGWYANLKHYLSSSPWWLEVELWNMRDESHMVEARKRLPNSNFSPENLYILYLATKMPYIIMEVKTAKPERALSVVTEDELLTYIETGKLPKAKLHQFGTLDSTGTRQLRHAQRLWSEINTQARA
jgi:hypothetical protein